MNTVRPSAAPADEIQQAKKQVEEELSAWMAEGRLNDAEANEVRTIIGELLDGYAVGEATKEEVEAAYGKIRGRRP